MSRSPLDPVKGTDRHHALPPREEMVTVDGTVPGATASVPDLLRRLSGEGSELVRKEIELAKAEMDEKLDTLKRSAATMAAGGGLLLAGLLFALWTLNTGVTAALVQVVSAAVAVWLAPLLLAAVLLAIGWALISSAKKTMAHETLTPEGSRESLRRDLRWAEGKAKQAKEEVTQ